MAKILLVEDDEIIRKIMVRHLEVEGHEVTWAVNGAEGLAQTRTKRPHIILMDLRMPVMDGWEATRQLRAIPELSHIPIIALTAVSTSEERQLIFAAGCDAIVSKPVNFAELTSRINDLLA